MAVFFASSVSNGQIPMVAADSVRVLLGSKAVLDGFSISVPSSCIVGLLGSSGCGKSTFMNACAGLVSPSSGHLEIAGKPPERGRLDVGFCTQYDSFYSDLTVGENVSFFGKLMDLTPTSLAERSGALLGQCGLSDLTDRTADLLSGGQKRRLNLVLSALSLPAVLLVDEPTVGLDPLTRKEIWQLLRAMRSSGMTILISTHYMAEAESLCDKVAIMAKGSVAAYGTIGQLRERFVPNELVRLVSQPADLRVLKVLESRLKAAQLATSIVYEPSGLAVSSPDPKKTIGAMYAFLKTTNESVVLLDVQEPSFNDVFELATQGALGASGSTVTKRS